MEVPYFLVVLLVTSLASSSTQQRRQIDPEIERKISEYIENIYIPDSNVTTLSLTIVQNDGETLYTNGYGWANEEKQIPNTNDTQFLVASISKSLTSVILIKTLNEKFPNWGDHVLDIPIRQLMPEFNFTLIDRFRSEHGTVRDLLGHRMCLPSNDFIYIMDAIDSTAEIAYRQRYNEEKCDIRADFKYANQMYVLAGEILSHLTGKSFEETADEFLKELGMENSHFVRRTDDFENTPEIARPYFVDYKDGLVKPVNPDVLMGIASQNAAGGWLISPNEMARYLRFHLNLGMLDGKQIVPEEVMLWIRQPAIYTRLYRSYAYGQGLFFAEYEGQEYFHHGGSSPPFESDMSFYPAHNLSIFTSSNMGPVRLDQRVLHTFILETFMGAEDAEEKAKRVADEWKSSEEMKQKAQAKEQEKIWNEMVSRYGNGAGRAEPLGKYGNGAQGELELIMKEDEFGREQLYLMYGKLGNGWLDPLMPGGGLYLITFESDVMDGFYRSGQFWLSGGEEAVAIIYMFSDLLPGQNFGEFWAGVSLDKLPPIPWEPDSCRAELKD